MNEQETSDRLSAVMSGFIGRVINDELYADINAALGAICYKVTCDRSNNTPDMWVRGNVRAYVVVDGVHYTLDIEGARAVPVKLISEAKIEAGARALAELFFWCGTQQKLSWFTDGQQNDFRTKARAVLIATEGV